MACLLENNLLGPKSHHASSFLHALYAVSTKYIPRAWKVCSKRKYRPPTTGGCKSSLGNRAPATTILLMQTTQDQEKLEVMTSEKQIQANQGNVRKSTGPQSPQGKAAVRLNARTHGLRSQEVLLPGEDEEALKGLDENLRAELQPVGEL